MPGPWQEAIRSFTGRLLDLALGPDESAVDRQPPEVAALSRSSRAPLPGTDLASEAGIADEVDGRRFRMLFEIDGVRPHEEDGWIGAEVQAGEATLRFNGDVGRCVVTSRDPDTGEIDLPTLVTLAAYRPDGRTEPLPFGIYGSVVSPGRVRVGDSVLPG